MLRQIILPLSLILAMGAIAQHGDCTSVLETVAQQVGETVNFCGTPAQVTIRGKDNEGPLFLNFGGNYPDNTFTVVIWGSVAGDTFNELQDRYSGKTLLIHGVVAEHNGKPEIKLAALKDIEIQEE